MTIDGEIVDALGVIRSLGSNTTWGSPIRNRNVLFLPIRSPHSSVGRGLG